MSTNSNRQVSYGLSQPLINEAQVPIIAQRIPTTSDKAQIGTIWIDQVTNAAYILTSIVNNMAMWEGIGGPASALTFDTDSGTATPSGDVIDIAGGTNMNTSGLGNIVTINLDDTVSIAGSFTAVEDITTTAGNFNLPLTTSDGTEGVIMLGGRPFMIAPGTDNTFLGEQAGTLTISGIGNTSMGAGALAEITSGQSNTAMGLGSGLSIITGSYNTMVGQDALGDNIEGTYNTAIGFTALNVNGADTGVGGNYNVAVGARAGTNYSHDESSNILVGAYVFGTSLESNVIRIGNQGSGDTEQNQCFIAGISGSTVTGSAVLCSTTGQLGTISSSRRYKENIEDIEDIDITSLRPVKFNYKKNSGIHYGMIAEEVEELMPELVLYDAEGKVDSISYHEMPGLLLNEIKKLKKRIEQLERRP